MTEPVEFEQLEARVTGSNVVVFQLSNGAILKLHITLARIGKAVNAKNPDGTDMYNFGFNVTNEIVFPNKKFTVPRDQLPPTVPPTNPKGKTYG